MDTQKFDEIADQILNICHENNIPAIISLVNAETEIIKTHICNNFPMSAMNKLSGDMVAEGLERMDKRFKMN